MKKQQAESMKAFSGGGAGGFDLAGMLAGATAEKAPDPSSKKKAK